MENYWSLWLMSQRFMPFISSLIESENFSSKAYVFEEFVLLIIFHSDKNIDSYMSNANKNHKWSQINWLTRNNDLKFIYYAFTNDTVILCKVKYL